MGRQVNSGPVDRLKQSTERDGGGHMVGSPLMDSSAAAAEQNRGRDLGVCPPTIFKPTAKEAKWLKQQDAASLCSGVTKPESRRAKSRGG